jgi:hypothetical protein
METLTTLNEQTLFDDLILGAIMKVTGTDELGARFMLALHRGSISGDVQIEGREFRGTPLRRLTDDPAPAEIQVASPTWHWRTVTGTRVGAGATTLSVSFSEAYEHSLKPVA